MIVPASRGDVEVVVVEKDPGVGLLCGLIAFARLLHDEVAGWRHDAIHLFVQCAVDLQRLLDPYGADGCAAFVIARNDGGWYRRWRTVNDRDGGGDISRTGRRGGGLPTWPLRAGHGRSRPQQREAKNREPPRGRHQLFQSMRA